MFYESDLMEQVRPFHTVAPSGLNVMAMGKRGQEWDLNDWKWDGDLFIATPSPFHPSNFQGQQFVPVVPIAGNSSNSSSSCSDDVHSGIDNGRRELERKRRVIVVEEDSLDDSGSLTLKLGGNCYPVPEREAASWEGVSGKKTKMSGGSSNRAVCQVEDCGADLTKAKDYHRRHKVCEMHSKATKALVANVMQRFCQQCSRFHALQEFDEGKRSCRRRLAGHNKRRRKTQPEATVHGSSINDEQTNSVLLISLLKILSNLHANNGSDQNTDRDLLAQLLRSLANTTGLHTGKGITSLLHESQKLLNGGVTNGNSEKTSSFLSNDHQNFSRVNDQHLSLPDSEISRKGVHAVDNRGGEMQGVSSQKPGIMFPIKDSPPTYAESTAGRMKLNNFDLNDTYVDSDDGMEDLERSPVNGNFTTSLDFPSWARQDSHQSSPPQTSGNSDSASAPSPSSSSGEAQSRTDRIVFKLFGKEPSEFPILLRGQIIDWLAHSPTDIESYIRPGCIILTIYLRLADNIWEELCSDLSSCLTRLLDISDNTFWRTGWVYVRVQDQIAIVYNGQIALDTSLPLQNSNCGKILSVVPIAVSIAEQAHFQIRGSNLSNPTTRLLCALEGKYLDREGSQELQEDSDSLEDDDDETECVKLSCSMPNVVGRGFIEVEDNGLSSSFFPFIVAEKDVCSEIRTLESVLELKEADEDAYEMNGKSEAQRQAMDFINEMGWLLHRSHLQSRLGHLDPNTVIFSFKRFKWLMDFSMDHDWCAVVKKLLDILVAGTLGSRGHPSLKAALSEMGLLHRAVRRNCRSMVELLLRYAPESISEEFESTTDESQGSLLFTPDAQGPAGLTPLHVAAGRDGSEDVLDALTDDPGKVGVVAWKNARDSTGSTPEDYARLRGHYAYIHLVQRKINRTPVSGHVVVDIPSDQSGAAVFPKQDVGASFEIGRSGSLASKKSCRVCERKMGYYGPRVSLGYRPAMLSMVAIAAVCVCMALMFRGMPNVVFLFRPFRWELLDFGSS